MKHVHNESIAQFLRGMLALGRRLRSERPSGCLSLSGLGILSSLNRHGPLLATQLAAEEKLQPQSLSRLIRELERDGLITRNRSDNDRREILITITGKGKKALSEDIAARRTWLENAMAATLNQKERDAILAVTTLMLKLASYDANSEDDEI